MDWAMRRLAIRGRGLTTRAASTVERCPEPTSEGARAGIKSCPLQIFGNGRRNMIIEIRAAEGGDDAKLLVVDQFRIYSKLAERRGL